MNKDITKVSSPAIPTTLPLLKQTLVLALLSLGCGGGARYDAPPTLRSGGARWTVVADWPRLPSGLTLGAVSGVAVSPQGNVVIVHRGDRRFNETGLADTTTIKMPVIVELDATTGAVLRTWGAGAFLIPHSLTIDSKGNYWITDVGRQQILKFSDKAELLLTVGEWRKAGETRSLFNLPTDVVVNDDGSFFVSDGYRNSRIIQFDSNGVYIREWGEKGSARGQLDTPHGVARDGDGDLYVADRENFRVQKFNAAGQFIRQWPESPDSSLVFDVEVTRSGLVYVALDRSRDAVAILDSGFRPIGRISFDSTSALFGHNLTVVGDSVIYLADTDRRRVVKIAKR